MCTSIEVALLGCAVWGLVFFMSGVIGTVVGSLAVSRMPVSAFSVTLLWVGSTVCAVMVTLAGLILIALGFSGRVASRKNRTLMLTSGLVFLLSSVNLILMEAAGLKIWHNPELRGPILEGYESLYYMAFFVNMGATCVGLASSFLACEYIYFLLVKRRAWMAERIEHQNSSSEFDYMYNDDQEEHGEAMNWVYENVGVKEHHLSIKDRYRTSSQSSNDTHNEYYRNPSSFEPVEPVYQKPWARRIGSFKPKLNRQPIPKTRSTRARILNKQNEENLNRETRYETQPNDLKFNYVMKEPDEDDDDIKQESSASASSSLVKEQHRLLEREFHKLDMEMVASTLLISSARCKQCGSADVVLLENHPDVHV